MCLVNCSYSPTSLTMKKSSDNLFKSICNDTYQRRRRPNLVTVVPIAGCLQDLDLLVDSITYSLMYGPLERISIGRLYWPLLSRAMWGDSSSFVSLVFTKPASMEDLRVTVVRGTDDLLLLPKISDMVCANLANIVHQ